MDFFGLLPKKTLRFFFFALWLAPKWSTGVDFFLSMGGQPPHLPMYDYNLVINLIYYWTECFASDIYDIQLNLNASINFCHKGVFFELVKNTSLTTQL